MSSDSEVLLQQVLAMSRQLLRLVKAGEIDQAVTLEKERFQLLRHGMAADPQESVEGRIAVLREIQTLDKEITAAGQSEQTQISQQLRLIRQGQKAGKAYQQGR